MKKVNEKLIFVISAPSGAGKTTIIKEFLKKHKNFVLSISATTREKRINETNGKDYYFISKEKFKRLIRQNKFLEWAKVVDNYYGTLKSEVYENIKKGKNIIMDIDVKGAKQIKRKINDCVMIFIIPPSINELKKRLLKRKTENKETIKKRLLLAKKELKERKKYDYIIINKNIKDAVNFLESIYYLEKFKRYKI